jgi:hypothetical protein
MLDSSQHHELGEIHVALGALGVFLVVVPFGGIIPEILPVRLGEQDWRFGALGYFLDALTLPSVGLVVCLVAAALRQSVRGSRLTAGVALVIAVGAAIALPVFLREGMMLAGSAPDQRVAPVFERAMQKTGLVALFALPCLALTGIAGLRQGRRFEKTLAASKSTLVV